MIIIIIIIIPNVPLGSRVWVRKSDGQSIPVLLSHGVLEESGQFYPQACRIDMSDNVSTREQILADKELYMQ